ncbi:HlyD family type I secretion periplasmic adaptor subunit [Pseudomonas viridiflava]|uniref:HlyD family type I secretion periplasmic adaptor subunit n=1 Tax=Pseudomonas viridiflava TaxID=33069 RepID=UPI0013C32780|nr:HlyD family type I secretion periplasmic adaptor subunit [Pseudomonas viridiflava]
MFNKDEGSLVQRYRSVWRQAWRRRREMDAPIRLPHEVQFLPASMELQERPIHPAPRIFIWLIITFAFLALLWAIAGKVDVVATAKGKIIPSGKTKIIQSSETAVVKAIHVRDGQSVKAGQLLVELDSTSADADLGRIRNELLAARVDSARASEMLNVISTNKTPKALTGTINDADHLHVLAAERWLQGQYLEYRSNLSVVDAEISQRDAEIHSAREQVANLQKTLPIAVNLALDYKHLLDKQYIARHAYLEKEQARLELERQLGMQRARVVELGASRREAEQRREYVVAQARRVMLDMLQQSEQKISALTQEMAKARYQEDLTTLEAPVNGTVQQLEVHTIGGVVSPAQALMVLVPDGELLEVEAMLENKDIGFVHAGQKVTIKVETFNFTKYGTVGGEIVSISSDAIDDEKKGLIYSSKIRLDDSHLSINGVNVNLVPGMAVTAEVATDKRRVIEYFLSPLQQHMSESIRER